MSSGDLNSGVDEEAWDSMAVMAAEQWNKGEADDLEISQLVSRG